MSNMLRILLLLIGASVVICGIVADCGYLDELAVLAGSFLVGILLAWKRANKHQRDVIR